MEKTNFWKTKIGGQSIAFAVIFIAFLLIVFGNGSKVTDYTGFAMMILGMCYSPFRVFVIERNKK